MSQRCTTVLRTRSPSTFRRSGSVVERMRDAFLGEHGDAEVLRAEVSCRSARRAAASSCRSTCRCAAPVRTAAAAAKRGPSRARLCCGTGESLFHHPVRVSVPPGVADGARFRFRVRSPRARVRSASKCASRIRSVQSAVKHTDRSDHSIRPADPIHARARSCLPRRLRRRALHRLGSADDARRRVDAGARRRRGRADRIGRPRRRRRQVAAGLTAAAFTTLALIAIIWGAAHVVVGVPLRRRAWARLLALMLGSVDLVLLPYGTALGVYALWVLLNETGQEAVRREIAMCAPLVSAWYIRAIQRAGRSPRSAARDSFACA